MHFIQQYFPRVGVADKIRVCTGSHGGGGLVVTCVQLLQPRGL